MGNEIGIRSGIRSGYKNSDSFSGTGGSGGTLNSFLARVVFVLLDDSNKEKFLKYGGWGGLGTIECTPFINNNTSKDVLKAVPISANLNVYPVVNEVVLITIGVSQYAQGTAEDYDPQYYYTNIISAWNNPEHNAIPNSDWVSKGASSVTDLFNQTGKVSRVIKAPGDISLEGRSGNIIRMGSSIKGFNGPFIGPDRSPLLTIVNKQKDSLDSKIASYEDINVDGSSLYMLNGHNVNFVASSINFDSYNVKINQDVAPQQPSPKESYIVPKLEKEPEKALEKAVDTPPDPKPVVNTVNPARENISSVTAGDDTELEDKPFPQEYFTLSEIEEFVDLKECAEEAPTKETDLPSTEADSGASKVYLEAKATTNIQWELQLGKTWCFVASVAMLLKSYKIATATQNNVYNNCVIKGGKYDGNLNPMNVEKTYNVKYKRQALPDSKKESYDIIMRTIKQRNGKPFILQRAGTSSKNHFVVIVGLNSQNRIVVLDPGKTAYKNGTYLSIDNLKTSGGSLRFFDK